MQTEKTKFRLPRQFADKWLAALRSGEYMQGQDYLKHNGRYCCLGVACAITEGVEIVEPEAQMIIYADEIKNIHLIPKELTGMRNSLPIELSTMNDNGSDFKQIANWVEENVELYG